uniref:Uncharacterized protein n=2 Tax=Corethron hystrix TaxID=216773 RepID=A0A7S1BY75_9STRA|mmetsp:Transcript_6595/g.14231  ORF Transcript_6595/g.14231 Transcript_6595/m.14231 type:complete len:352 (+) Transcript_6595:125-1180(+)
MADSIPVLPRRDAETRLPGIFSRDSKSNYILDFEWIVNKDITLRQRLLDTLRFFFLGSFFDFLRATFVLYGRSIPATIYDARAFEAEEGLSKAGFFEKHGFVILDHPVDNMEASDWEASDRDVNKLLKAYNNRTVDGGKAYQAIMHDFRNGDTPVKKKYAGSVESLLRSLIPRAKKIMPPARGIRRFPTLNPNKGPAKQVHNDYGLVFKEVIERNPFFDFEAQAAEYEETEADEYMLVNLWRPVRPMSEDKPNRSFPLCFMDSSTLDKNDFVTIDSRSLGFATSLRENPKQKFYYYPDMTINEVVVFKQFHQMQKEETARMPVFHTAFKDPAADETTEGRYSFEYRVSLLC